MKSLLTIFTLLLSVSVAYAENKEITLSCKIHNYEIITDTFIIKPDNNEIYWVNELKSLPIKNIDEGNIYFIGERSVLRTGKNNYISKVKTYFRINRVSGEIYLGNGSILPKGICTNVTKVF